jgi:hypothetical protein
MSNPPPPPPRDDGERGPCPPSVPLVCGACGHPTRRVCGREHDASPPRDDGESLGRFLYEKMSSPPRDDRWDDLGELRRAMWCAGAELVAARVLRERDAIQAELLDAARAVCEWYVWQQTRTGTAGHTAAYDRLRHAVKAAERT